MRGAAAVAEQGEGTPGAEDGGDEGPAAGRAEPPLGPRAGGAGVPEEEEGEGEEGNGGGDGHC